MNPGAVIASSFEIVRTIGSGGMGDVYQARRLRDGAVVALKILRLELLRDPEAVTRFRREGRAAAALRSPHAARIFEVGETEQGQPFIVMEYLEGCDLMHEIDTRGALPVVEALSFVAQACHAMIEAHELGIVHRDLKPPNIFLASEGNRRVAKVLDFGISKVQSINDARLTSTQMSFGSPLYMSPEQIRSTKLVDQRSDVWSLGVILYEALTGEPPFMGETPGALAVVISVEPHIPASHKNPKIPPGLDDVIAGALQKDPKKRYASVRELLRALEDFLPQTDLGLSATVREPPALPAGPPLRPPTNGAAPAPRPALSPHAQPLMAAPAASITTPPVVRELRATTNDVPHEQRGQTLVIPPSETLDPASRDLSRDRGRDRVGLILAAIFIPLGAAAFAFAIWLYAKRSATEKTPRSESAVSHEATPTTATPTPASTSASPDAPGSASQGVEPEPSASASGEASATSTTTAKAKPKPKPTPRPTSKKRPLPVEP